MTKCFQIIVALTFVLTGCASVVPGKGKVQTHAANNKVAPGYVRGLRGDAPHRLRAGLFGRGSFGRGSAGNSSKLSGPQAYDPDYAQYLDWKRWQEFKAYQEWKAKKESEAQGS